MGTPSAGEVVVVPFPFSDLTQSKVQVTPAAYQRVLSCVIAGTQKEPCAFGPKGCNSKAQGAALGHGTPGSLKP